MKQLADGVWQLSGLPPNGINVYLIEDVVIDAATRHSGRRILRQLDGHTVSAHALTHAHPDHQGASHEICTRLGIPFWVPEHDADAAEDTELIRERQPDTLMARVYISLFLGPGHPVDRRLADGDEIAGFRAIHSPGHSAGQVGYWRESDRTLIVGDVLTDMDTFTGIPGLHEPKPCLTPDPAENRRSAKRLAALEPNLVLFGHGRPLRDTARFVAFLDAL